MTAKLFTFPNRVPVVPVVGEKGPLVLFSGDCHTAEVYASVLGAWCITGSSCPEEIADAIEALNTGEDDVVVIASLGSFASGWQGPPNMRIEFLANCPTSGALRAQAEHRRRLA